MLLTIVGYAIIIIIILLLIKEKASLPPIFILVPIIGALICGFTFGEICGFVSEGINAVLNTAILFAFSILYFSILGEIGIFDALARFLVKHMGNNIFVLLLVTFIMATIIQIDGSGAMTMLITIPIMLPLYDAMKIRRTVLVCVCSMGAGVMNMLPWCSAMLRVSAGTGLEAQDIWKQVLPIQIVTFIAGLLVTLMIGMIEKRRGVGMNDQEFLMMKRNMETHVELKVPISIAVIDIVITIVLIALLLTGAVTSTVGFMAGLGIILVVNYRTTKEQDDIIKKYSKTAYPLVLTILAIGVMLGIMQGPGAIEASAKSLMNMMPDSCGRYITLIYGILGVPISMLIGSDCCYSVIAPLLGTISSYYGGGMMQAASAVIITSSMAASVSFVGPVPYMTVGLAGISMNENVRFSFKYLWLMGIIMVVSAKLLGII